MIIVFSALRKCPEYIDRIQFVHTFKINGYKLKLLLTICTVLKALNELIMYINNVTILLNTVNYSEADDNFEFLLESNKLLIKL